MATELREMLDPTDEEAAAQARIVDSLTTRQYDGMSATARAAYDGALSRYESVRGLLRSDERNVSNGDYGAAVERRLNRMGVNTAAYDYVQVRIGPDHRELRFLGDEDRTVDISTHSVVGDLYRSVRGGDDRTPGEVVRDGMARNALRPEIRDARETAQRCDVPHAVTRTVVFPRDE